MSSPAPENAQLTGLSCYSVDDCYAAGGRVVGLGLLIEHWDGTTWETSVSRGGPAAELTAISCSTASSCTAVGGSQDAVSGGCSSSVFVLGQRGWVSEVPADAELVCHPGTPFAYVLDAVSCSSGSRCVAVGQWESHLGIEIALAEASSGATWTLQRFPGGVTRQQSSVDGHEMASAPPRGIGCASTVKVPERGPDAPAGAVAAVPATASTTLAVSVSATGHLGRPKAKASDARAGESGESLSVHLISRVAPWVLNSGLRRVPRCPRRIPTTPPQLPSRTKPTLFQRPTLLSQRPTLSKADTRPKQRTTAVETALSDR
jgi:hypothetical protein